MAAPLGSVLGASALVGALIGCQELPPVVPVSDAPPPAAPATTTAPAVRPRRAGPCRPQLRASTSSATARTARRRCPISSRGWSKLGLNEARSAAPSGVNPAFWQLLAPRDNALDARRIALGKKL